MPMETVNHRGTEIFVLDTRDCPGPEELTALFSDAVAHLETKAPNSVAMLTLTKGTIRMTGPVRKMSDDFSKRTNGYTRHSAIVGLGPAQRVIVRILSPRLHVTDDEEKAKDWLHEQMTAA